MNLKAFAAKHRLKIKLDECGDAIVQGKFGTIYEYSDELLGLTFSPPTAHGRMWGNAKRLLATVKMAITQDGDAEGAATFDPTDSTQVKVAIHLVKPRAKRQISPETRERLRKQLAGSILRPQTSL